MTNGVEARTTEIPVEEQKRLLFRQVDAWARSKLVAKAFRRVDRAAFIPPGGDVSLAYKNDIIYLKDGSSISQPTLTAMMIDYLGPTGKENVLEIGTGSGYSAAVLSLCAAKVDTVEYDEALANSADERLKSLGYKNVNVHSGDGALGLIEKAPFDAIIVTAGTPSIPAVLIRQLAIGGRIVIPVGKDPLLQHLVVGIQYPEGFLTWAADEVTFYSLMSQEQGGWTKETIQKARAYKRAVFLESALAYQKLSEKDVINDLANKAGISPESYNLDEHLKGVRFQDALWKDFEG